MADEQEGVTQEPEEQEQEEQEQEQPVQDSDTSADEQQTDDSQNIQEDKDDDDVDLFSMTDEEYENYINTHNASSTKVQQEQPDNTSETKQEPVEQTDAQKKYVKSAKKEKEQQPEEHVDYEAFYKQVMTPFKANGKEIRLNNPNDVIRLMQMGAGYNKRMEQLKPVKRAAETLRKANIDEQTLNLLIDINNGDKEALKTFLKNKQIDPTELDLDEVNYKPTKGNIASDDEVEFSDIVREIDDSLPKIQEILDKKWDSGSKKQLLEHPQLLRQLHQEIQLGRFDAIQAEVENQKALGNYAGKTDLEAYIQIVTAVWNAQQEKAKKEAEQKQASSNQTKKQEQVLKNREAKLKAAPNKNIAKPKAKKISNIDLANMSDEDFVKLNL